MTRLPVWALSATFDTVRRAYQAGRLTAAEWARYQAVWYYSAPRFSNLVPLPDVSVINAELDRTYGTDGGAR